jgi:hypothetical protein
MSTKGTTIIGDSAAPPASAAHKLRLLRAISSLLCMSGLVGCSPPLAGPVASLSSSTASSDFAGDATSDETSPPELARIYPLAGSRPSHVASQRTAQVSPTKKVVQTPREPDSTGAVAPRNSPLVDPENEPGRLAIQEQYRSWDAVAQRATGRVCTGC